MKYLALFLIFALLLGTVSACTPANDDPVLSTETAGTSADVTSSTTETTAATTQTTESTTVTTAEPAPTIDYTEKTYSVVDHRSSFKVLGRSVASTDSIALDWSLATIEFSGYCKGTVYIRLSASFKTVTSQNIRFNVFIDGVKKATTLDVGREDQRFYTVASNLSEGFHSFRVVRITQCELANGTSLNPMTVNCHGVKLTGELSTEAPANRAKYIEFLGDSITVGSGISTDYMEGTKAFPFLVSELLNCDYSVVASSGIGLVKSSDRHGSRVFSTFYEYTNYFRNQTEKYTAERKADLVVVNLGTNDYYRNPTETEFKTGLTELIASIRKIHGDDVKILFVTDMMVSKTSFFTLRTWMSDVTNGLTGSTNISYVSVSTNNAGGNSHPSADGHVTAANQIRDKILYNHLLE